MALTLEQIQRLKKYVDANRYYIVKCHDQQVFSMEYPPNDPQWSILKDTTMYTENYDCYPPDTFFITGDVNPEDIIVFKKSVDWQSKDPEIPVEG